MSTRRRILLVTGLVPVAGGLVVAWWALGPDLADKVASVLALFLALGIALIPLLRRGRSEPVTVPPVDRLVPRVAETIALRQPGGTVRRLPGDPGDDLAFLLVTSTGCWPSNAATTRGRDAGDAALRRGTGE